VVFGTYVKGGLVENKDKYICPGKEKCKRKTCLHAKLHKREAHCFGGTCYIMRDFIANTPPVVLAALPSLVCVKIKGEEKK